MNITITSAFPIGRERNTPAKVSYEFQLDDPGTEVPLHAGLLAGRQFFPPALTGMLTLGNDLPVQVSRLGPSPKDWHQPRPVTESFDIAAFAPEKLLEILQPGEEALIGLTVQAVVNGQAVNDGKPMEKNLLVRHETPMAPTSSRIKIVEVETPTDALQRQNIYNVIGRTAGAFHTDQPHPYSPSDYFGWPANAWGRNRVVGDKTYQVRHLGRDLFLGGQLVLEPVVEAERGPAEVHKNGTLVGYDLIAIGWGLGESGRREVQSQILQEFKG